MAKKFRNEIRLSGPALRMLKIFVEHPTKEFSGAEIAKVTGIGSGTLYPLLARFEQERWLTSRWEKIDPSEEKRPRRHFYKITGHGQNSARQALAELQTDLGEFVWKRIIHSQSVFSTELSNCFPTISAADMRRNGVLTLQS